MEQVKQSIPFAMSDKFLTKSLMKMCPKNTTEKLFHKNLLE